MANTADLKGKLKEKVEASAERGILSKTSDYYDGCTNRFSSGAIRSEAPDFEKVKEIFEELEFRRLYENMYRAFAPKGEPVQAAAEETVKSFATSRAA